MKEIKWGMIGTGDVTEKKSAPSFNKIKGSELIAVMNRTHAKAIRYAERHAVPKVFETAEELIADEEVNAVYIATPPSTHAEYSIKAMKAGKPVYVEKPMATTYSECVQMNEVSRETGTPLFVAYYRRSMDYFLKVRDLLDEELIGRPLFCTSRLFIPPRPEDFDRKNLLWRVMPEISGGGYFHDMGCHGLDILMFLLGDISSAKGYSANVRGFYEPEDTVVASAVFENGMLYNGSWSFGVSSESSIDEIEITGEKGSIKFSCFEFSPIQVIYGDGRSEFPIAPPENVQLPMITSIVGELMGEGKSPSHGDSGARVSWLMEEILASR